MIRKDLTFLDLAKYDGYTAEEHYVTTEDGYILRMFRIPPKDNCRENKGPIMFMHGLYLSGDDCIVPGPGQAHCYIYADSCYDVWVPNVRGNVYSRNHTKYNPDIGSQFWDFSVDEIGLYDVPAVIDYVLTTTNNAQLTYIGHSQGVTVLLILCAKRPEYNAKIKVGFGLSVTAWLNHARFIVIQLQSLLVPLLTRSDTLSYNEYQITSEVLPVVVGHVPSGTSLKNFNRWGQIKNNGFAEYDYGEVKNLILYGKPKPPLYDLSQV
ncbi:lipase 1-like [Anticarsia gemmatalis]|uniref:lipase 1-like n=1 Tax=Anticarsia gemmatalis TaxID=129554 RepID=UPI003F76A44A